MLYTWQEQVRPPSALCTGLGSLALYIWSVGNPSRWETWSSLPAKLRVCDCVLNQRSQHPWSRSGFPSSFLPSPTRLGMAVASHCAYPQNAASFGIPCWLPFICFVKRLYSQAVFNHPFWGCLLFLPGPQLTQVTECFPSCLLKWVADGKHFHLNSLRKCLLSINYVPDSVLFFEKAVVSETRGHS